MILVQVKVKVKVYLCYLVTLLNWNSHGSLYRNIGAFLLRNVETFLNRHLNRHLMAPLLGNLATLSLRIRHLNLLWYLLTVLFWYIVTLVTVPVT